MIEPVDSFKSPPELFSLLTLDPPLYDDSLTSTLLMYPESLLSYRVPVHHLISHLEYILDFGGFLVYHGWRHLLFRDMGSLSLGEIVALRLQKILKVDS